MKDHPFYKIHHINSRFNRVFDVPIFYAATFVTFLNLLLPYSLRTVLAFLINIFFNRPVVYLNFIAEKISKRINLLVLAVFYFTLFGLYSIGYKAYCSVKKDKNDSSLKNIPARDDVDYMYQS